MSSLKRDNSMANSFLTWSRRYGASLTCAMVAGGIGIPFLHYLIYSNTDPFAHGWPVCLQASAFLSAFAITMILRVPTASALGNSIGLVGFMLTFGAAEYPVASAIGLAIHGLLPAALGSASAFGLIWRTPQESIVVNPDGDDRSFSGSRQERPSLARIRTE